MTFDEALSYLLSLGHETLTIKLGLQNTERLLEALGNPHKDFSAVQIAGTNGKGSTAVMLDSICRAAGMRTGLFTSPHLISITERIRINGAEISETEFARVAGEVKTVAAALVKTGRLATLPTFFEHITAIALLAFRDARIDLAILETGLGGRLDSTTAAGAKMVAITQIAMDHEEFLGQTLPEIAAEKAAIIRPGVIAVIAPQVDEAREVIRRRCEAVAVDPRFVSEYEVSKVRPSPNATPGRLCATFETKRHRYENLCIGLAGRHQLTNAATAVALAEALPEIGLKILPDAVIRGIESARHAGRMEFWPGQLRILFDGAHNPAAARMLREYLDEFVSAPVTMIFGAMRDKSLGEMAAALFPAATQLVLTEFDNPRAAGIASLRAVVPPELDPAKTHSAASPEEALQLARELTDDSGLICVTGSLYLIGAIQEILCKSADTLPVGNY